MRITNSMTYRSLLNAMQERTQGQFDAQQALSTGIKLQHARDNPVAAATVMKSEDQLALISSQNKALDVVEMKTSQAESRLGDLNDILQSARELLVRSLGVAINDEDREILADQMRDLASDVVSIGNTRGIDGRPLFSGTSPESPFSGTAGSWSLDPGAGAPIQVEVAPGRTLPAGVDAREAFLDSTGSVDLATLLEGFADTLALAPADEAAKAAQRDAISGGLDEMDAAIDRTSRVRSAAGLTLQAVDNIREFNEVIKANANEQLSDLRDADIAEEVSKLANENASLEAARAVFQRLEQQSLFNYL